MGGQVTIGAVKKKLLTNVAERHAPPQFPSFLCVPLLTAQLHAVKCGCFFGTGCWTNAQDTTATTPH